MALSWFRSLLHRKPQSAPRHSRGPGRPAPFRPRLEALETRLAPATWDGGGATNNWSDRFNWVGDVAPVTGNALVFPATGVDPTSKNNVNDFTDNRAFSSITFSGSGYNITGQSIQILGGTITAGTGSSALNLDINYSTLTLTGAGTLTLGGALAGGNITKTGASRFILSHDNPNFTGQMLVNAGAIIVANSGALGASGSAANGTIVNSGTINHGRVELSGDGVNVGPEVLTLDGFAAKLVNSTGSGNNSWAGPITFPGSASATLRGITSLSGQLTLSGVIGSTVAENGIPQIEIEGLGTTVFAGSAANTHAGTIRVSGGHLALQKSGGAQAIVGPLEVINSGNVRWGDNDQISNAVTVKVEQGSLDLNGFTETIGPLNLDLATITTGAGTLILTGNVTQGIPSGPGGNSTIAGNVTMGGNSGGTFTVNPTSSTGDLVISAVIQGPSSKKLVKEGTGRLVLSGANQYTGQTVVNAGRLAITNAQALGAPNPSKAFFLQDGTDVKGGAALELRADAGNFTVVGEDLRFGGTGIGFVGTGALRNLSGSNTWAGSVAFTPFFGDNMAVGVDGTSELTLDGLTFGGGNGNAIKVGTGRLIFTGSVISDLASTGTFEVRQGTVNVRGSATVGSKSADVFVFSGAALELQDRTADFDQASVHLNGSGTGIAGALRLLGGTATASSPIFLDSNSRIGVNSGAALTLTGVISGALANEFRKMGGGTLILDAANSYAASTVVAQGTLTVRDAAALGTTTNGTIVHPGGTLLIDRPITVIKEALTLGIANVAGEPILAGAGAHLTSAEWKGPVTLNNAATIQVDGTFTLRLSGNITSAAQTALTKKGTGTLSLPGSAGNTALDGPVVVNDGTLGLDKPGGLRAIDGSLFIGDGTGASGSARVTMLNSEQINNTAEVTVRRDGVFNLSNENETIFRLTMVGGTVNTGTGTLTVLQLRSQAAADTAFINGNLDPTGTLLEVTVADGTADPDLVINAAVSDFVRKLGAGSLVLNGNNTSGLLVLDGKTFVNGSQPAGTAQVNGDTAGTSAELGGTGTVGRISLLNGRLNPGAPGQAGILTATNGLVFGTSNVAGATRRFEVDLNGGLVAGTNFDQLNVIGAVNLGTNLTQLVLDAPAGFTANVGDAFVIINNDGTNDAVAGTFIGLAENSALTINNQPFRLSYRGVNGNDNDVVLIRTNTASMFPERAVTPVVAEGGFATLTGTIGDADLMDFFILDVNWGDGTPTETHVFEPGSPRQVSLQHRYLNNPAGQLSGQYQVTLQWRDQHGDGNSDVLSVTVNNANPTVFAGGDVTLGDGESLSRTGTITDAGVTDTHTATVDYGDGSGVQDLTVLADGSFQLTRSYARPGTYFVKVRATDSDGGVGETTFTVTA